jgi:hypothetical protein
MQNTEISGEGRAISLLFTQTVILFRIGRTTTTTKDPLPNNISNTKLRVYRGIFLQHTLNSIKESV